LQTPVSIKEQIKLLVELQNVDAKIYALNKEKILSPAEIAKLEKLFEEKKTELNTLEEKSKALTSKRKEKEMDLASKEESIKKFNSQLFSLKTNKEYQAMLEQIAGIKVDNSLIEEGILEIMEEQDLLRAEIAKEKGHLAEEEKKFQAEKKKVEQRVSEIDSLLGDLTFKRTQASQTIDKHLLANYDKILKGKDGLAIVRIVDNACQGCFINVTQQVINEIKMFDRIIECVACARMLYIEEDL